MTLMEKKIDRRLLVNIVANYAGTAISLVAPLLALPFLLSALGIKAWGLVSFSILLVTLITTFNSGISQAMISTFGNTLKHAEGGLEKCANLLFGYQRIYWIGSAVLGITILAAAPIIAHTWLELGGVDPIIAKNAVRLAGASFFVQLPASIYRTVLTAMQKLTTVNIIQSVFSILKAAGGVTVAFYTKSVIYYLLYVVLLTLFGSHSFFSTSLTSLCISKRTPANFINNGAFFSCSSCSICFWR